MISTPPRNSTQKPPTPINNRFAASSTTVHPHLQQFRQRQSEQEKQQQLLIQASNQIQIQISSTATSITPAPGVPMFYQEGSLKVIAPALSSSRKRTRRHSVSLSAGASCDEIIAFRANRAKAGRFPMHSPNFIPNSSSSQPQMNVLPFSTANAIVNSVSSQTRALLRRSAQHNAASRSLQNDPFFDFPDRSNIGFTANNVPRSGAGYRPTVRKVGRDKVGKIDGSVAGTGTGGNMGNIDNGMDRDMAGGVDGTALSEVQLPRPNVDENGNVLDESTDDFLELQDQVGSLSPIRSLSSLNGRGSINSDCEFGIHTPFRAGSSVNFNNSMNSSLNSSNNIGLATPAPSNHSRMAQPQQQFRNHHKNAKRTAKMNQQAQDSPLALVNPFLTGVQIGNAGKIESGGKNNERKNKFDSGPTFSDSFNSSLSEVDGFEDSLAFGVSTRPLGSQRSGVKSYSMIETSEKGAQIPQKSTKPNQPSVFQVQISNNIDNYDDIQGAQHFPVLLAKEKRQGTEQISDFQYRNPNYNGSDGDNGDDSYDDDDFGFGVDHLLDSPSTFMNQIKRKNKTQTDHDELVWVSLIPQRNIDGPTPVPGSVVNSQNNSQDPTSQLGSGIIFSNENKFGMDNPFLTAPTPNLLSQESLDQLALFKKQFVNNNPQNTAIDSNPSTWGQLPPLSSASTLPQSNQLQRHDSVQLPPRTKHTPTQPPPCIRPSIKTRLSFGHNAGNNPYNGMGDNGNAGMTGNGGNSNGTRNNTPGRNIIYIEQQPKPLIQQPMGHNGVVIGTFVHNGNGGGDDDSDGGFLNFDDDDDDDDDFQGEFKDGEVVGTNDMKNTSLVAKMEGLQLPNGANADDDFEIFSSSFAPMKNSQNAQNAQNAQNEQNSQRNFKEHSAPQSSNRFSSNSNNRFGNSQPNSRFSTNNNTTTTHGNNDAVEYDEFGFRKL
jgi:hypothetical protein